MVQNRLTDEDKMTQIKVFLGGTTPSSDPLWGWRGELIPMLVENNISCFNPVVVDWTPKCMAEEIRQRNMCDYSLYVITPEMTGVYAIAEAVDDSNKRPDKTIFCVSKSYDGSDFSKGQMMSLQSVGQMIRRNGGHFAVSLQGVVDILIEKTK